MKKEPRIRKQIAQKDKELAALNAGILAKKRQAEVISKEADKRRVAREKADQAHTLQLKQEEVKARAQLRGKP